MSARDFLLSINRHHGGVYTCLRVINRVIQSWEFHLKRLMIKDSEEITKLYDDIMVAIELSLNIDTILMVTVLKANDTYYIHVNTMPKLQINSNGDVKSISILVYGKPRTDACVKHVQWIEERKPLEQYAREKANQWKVDLFGEVLLHYPTTQEGTYLLEGLITNFFVVQHGMIYTADSDILHGSTRELVLCACRHLGIQVKYQAPRLEDSNLWEGAFVTSVVKLVVPVHSVYMDDGSAIHVEVPPMLSQLRSALIHMMNYTS